MSNERHGLTKAGMRPSEYSIWAVMKQRCHNPRNHRYPYYGARGIEVCARWRESFTAFLADMGPRPVGTTLDRVDNDKGYCKENCRWADAKTQMGNRRNARTFGDGQKSLSDLAAELGITRQGLDDRLRRGWSEADALSIPKTRKSGRVLTFKS